MWLTNSPINYLDRTLKLASSFGNVEDEISKHFLHEINIVKAVSEIGQGPIIIGYVLKNGGKMFPYPQGLVQLLVMSRVPGDCLGQIYRESSDAQLKSISIQLAHILKNVANSSASST